jgi:hypothetical protein
VRVVRVLLCTPGTVLVLTAACALSVCVEIENYQVSNLQPWRRWFSLSVVLPTALRILNALCQKRRTNSNLFIGIYELN